MRGPVKHLVFVPAVAALLVATVSAAGRRHDSASPDLSLRPRLSGRPGAPQRPVFLGASRPQHGPGAGSTRMPTEAAPRVPAATFPALPPLGLGSPRYALAPNMAGSLAQTPSREFEPRWTSWQTGPRPEHGWFYHWMNASNGERRWDSETSSVDTSFLLAGVLSCSSYFSQRF